MDAETSVPSWVEQAARLPVGFAQVREDALLDLRLLDQVAPKGRARAILIASGGCTAAALVASGRLARLHLVDANPTQISLTRLKLHLLRSATPRERRELLGHAPTPAAERGARLAVATAAAGLGAEPLRPPDVVAEVGPDHAGRYEMLFARLRSELREVSDELAALVALRDPDEQARRAAPETALGRALDDAFDRVMALPNLVRLFGAAATRNSREPFARHFTGRTRHVLATLPAADNPYLWQMLLGRFPDGVECPWLGAAAPSRMPHVTWAVADMETALAAATAGNFDFVHLSNILDWLDPCRAASLLERAASALRPGGYTLVRQLNSTLDVPSLGPQFDWLTDEARSLHARDRSFFYRSLHLGRKR